MSKINKEELDKRFKDLEAKYEKNNTLVHDLIDFCERTGVLPPMDLINYTDWREKLLIMRREEEIQQNIEHAIQILERHEYIVVKHESEIDAVKLKKWIANES